MENTHKFHNLKNISPKKKYRTKEKKIPKKDLVNKLNYINFQDGTILVNFEHTIYNNTISLKAKPLPCTGDRLACVWDESEKHHRHIAAYAFRDIFVPDDQKLLCVTSDQTSINENGIDLHLPEFCHDISSRKVKRNPCKDIDVQLVQNSTIFSGLLMDFSPVSFRIEITATPSQTFQWIDPESAVTIILSDRKEILYSGECRILKHSGNRRKRSFVIKPLHDQIQRFEPREFRCTRQEFNPPPNVIFRHPFTKKFNQLNVVDISGSGFSVKEDQNSAVLLPGMIIPNLELNFTNTFKAGCKAQVIYKAAVGDADNGNRMKCGVVFIDMNTEDHNKMLSMLHREKVHNANICTKIDLDELWHFFFETGFIYPNKYEFFQKNKEKIKETFKKLYTGNPEIARHFTYQEKGHILGHIAMLRFYDNSWLIHHYAASGSKLIRIGQAMLNQVGGFLNGSYRLYPNQMDFLFCYYRPENKFPDYVFGGIARKMKDPKKCSLDTFTYHYFQKSSIHESDLKEPWYLKNAQPEDLFELKNAYEHISAGLMLNVLELEPDTPNIEALRKKYQQLGFKRERYLFALKKEDRLKAVIMVNISDIGLNLSELTNSITVIVVDAAELSKDILYSALSQLSKYFEHHEIPVLLYPVSYAENHFISYTKRYNLWTLDTRYGDHYFLHLEGLIKKIEY